MRAWIFLVVLCTSLGVAHAGKPKLAAAKKAVAAWQKGLQKGGDFADAAALTADSFRLFVVKDASDVGCDDTVADRAKLPAALKCVVDAGAFLGGWSAYKPKDLKKAWDPLRDHVDEIAALAKTTTVLVHGEDGEGISVLTYIAVSLGADKQPHIAAIYAATMYR